MHVGSVLVLGPDALSYEQLLRLVGERLHLVPRYRQRIQPMPLGLLPTQWVDDPTFDLSYHVRASALPRPGSRTQLEEFVGRVIARRLDRTKPLWEMYFVEGLEGDEVALVVKSHMSLVGDKDTLDLVQVLLADQPTPVSDEPISWEVTGAPSPLRLAAGAAMGVLTMPFRAVTEPSVLVEEVREVTGRVVDVAGNAISTVNQVLTSPAPRSPLNTEVGGYRRYAMVSADLEDFRRIRAAFAKRRADREVTVNDVVLATITSALRNWMLARGQSAATGVQVRAMVPLSIYDTDPAGLDVAQEDARPARVEACFIDLPVGEPRPTMRLHQITYGMRQQVGGQAAVDARSLTSIGGFAPSRMHSVAARLGSLMSRRMFNLVVTNVPGPQQQMYAADAPLLASYPAVPLAHGQALTIGLTSYHGKMFLGLVADREAMPDLDLLAQCIPEAIDELLEVLKVRR